MQTLRPTSHQSVKSQRGNQLWCSCTWSSIPCFSRWDRTWTWHALHNFLCRCCLVATIHRRARTPVLLSKSCRGGTSSERQACWLIKSPTETCRKTHCHTVNHPRRSSRRRPAPHTREEEYIDYSSPCSRGSPSTCRTDRGRLGAPRCQRVLGRPGLSCGPAADGWCGHTESWVGRILGSPDWSGPLTAQSAPHCGTALQRGHTH